MWIDMSTILDATFLSNSKVTKRTFVLFKYLTKSFKIVYLYIKIKKIKKYRKFNMFQMLLNFCCFGTFNISSWGKSALSKNKTKNQRVIHDSRHRKHYAHELNIK